MAFVVEMIGGVEGASWHFCCAALVWEQVLQLARENGWQPLGTRPDPVWKQVWDEYGGFSRDYQCEDRGKVVSAADAAAIADSLERASTHPVPVFPQGPMLLREGMTAEDYRRANAELNSDFLADFIEFLRNGEFSFFWDD
jgi:hypothetical protein